MLGSKLNYVSKGVLQYEILTVLKQNQPSHIQVGPGSRSLQWRYNGVSNHQPHDCLSSVYSVADQRKHQSSASLAFVRGIHRWPVNSPHKGPVKRKCFHLMTSSWGRAAVAGATCRAPSLCSQCSHPTWLSGYHALSHSSPLPGVSCTHRD